MCFLPMNPDEYELISGVPDNSRVVIAGQTKLVNGMEVEIAVSD